MMCLPFAGYPLGHSVEASRGLSRGLMIEKIQGARWRLAYFVSYRRGAESFMVLLMAALHDLRVLVCKAREM